MKNLLLVSKIIEFFSECQTLYDGATGVKTIGDFVAQVEFLAEEKFPNHRGNDLVKNKYNSFKGDMLEILAEIFFAILSSHPAVGLIDYAPVSLSEDYGVDGIGINVNGDQVAVQVKYRANPLDTITWEDMAKTESAGRNVHHLSLEKNDTVFLFTTSGGITPAVEHCLRKKIRVIDRPIIAGIIDNNQNFWHQVEELITNTLSSLQEPCQST